MLFCNMFEVVNLILMLFCNILELQMVDAYNCECLIGDTDLYQCTGSVGRVQFYSSVVSADYERRNYARDVNQYVDVLYNLNNFNRYF